MGYPISGFQDLWEKLRGLSKAFNGADLHIGLIGGLRAMLHGVASCVALVRHDGCEDSCGFLGTARRGWEGGWGVCRATLARSYPFWEVCRGGQVLEREVSYPGPQQTAPAAGWPILSRAGVSTAGSRNNHGKIDHL